jgi:hypothetical protein
VTEGQVIHYMFVVQCTKYIKENPFYGIQILLPVPCESVILFHFEFLFLARVILEILSSLPVTVKIVVFRGVLPCTLLDHYRLLFRSYLTTFSVLRLYRAEW